ncbi:glycoside hydrolase family 32 protein [Virgibacillus halodenitrificans]|uniref:glycoside hydrolase family 32 protein n=1 Tax=Virgibacillus halodenitrificans TaxID=1482 RepID=UPI00045D08BA|nr:sucrose-6-phosphate hydrolase [Virgibacillus halodenitrificans]CDQ31754.1 Sucrose-6-phosphate hydrolase [Virgibacillus halodenitrificans]
MKHLHPIKKALQQIKEKQDIAQSDPHRLHFHIMPPVGLLNDPNGFVFYQGHYHIFYQWNPFATTHGQKYWGHRISSDLVHWEEAPIALAPDEWFDKDGCYSGSAIVHNEKLYIFYTGNVKDHDGNRASYQCLAVSDDGLHFDKKGPIIEVPKGYTAHFRDPKVFSKDGRWFMVIGAQNTQEQGEVILYSSPDLENWFYRGPLTGSHRNGLDNFGYMWECPDLFQIKDQDILIVSPQGLEAKGYKFNNIYQSGYFTGQVDYESSAYQHGSFEELDRGFDFYAPQTTVDESGRRLLFGWMGNAEVGETQHPTAEYGWIHALTLPRTLQWKKGKLFQTPVKELAVLRKNEVVYENITIINQHKQFNEVAGKVFELQITVTDWSTNIFSLTVGESTLRFNQNSSTFSLERKCFNNQGTESRHCHLDKLENIQLFKDTSSLEVFINNGEEVFTSRIFDDTNEQAVSFQADGQVTFDLQKWDLEKIFN